MGILIAQDGDIAVLDASTVQGVFGKMRLFKNDRIPAVTDVLADYIQADFNGYVLIQPVWSPAFTNVMGKGQMNGTSITWISADGAIPNMIYGLYCESSGGKLSFVDRFDVPINVNAGGIVIFYQPVITAVTA